MLVLLVGCVVAVDSHVTIEEPVDGIVVAMGKGEVTIAGEPGPVVIVGALTGPSDGEPTTELVDGVLTLDLRCDFCGGEVALDAPPETWVEVTLGAGSVLVAGMAAEVAATVEAGEIGVEDQGPGAVDLDVRLGEVALERRAPGDTRIAVRTGEVEVDVPAGGWRLEVEAPHVEIDPGVVDDPDGPLLRVGVAHGAVEVAAGRVRGSGR